MFLAEAATRDLDIEILEFGDVAQAADKVPVEVMLIAFFLITAIRVEIRRRLVNHLSRLQLALVDVAADDERQALDVGAREHVAERAEILLVGFAFGVQLHGDVGDEVCEDRLELKFEEVAPVARGLEGELVLPERVCLGLLVDVAVREEDALVDCAFVVHGIDALVWDLGEARESFLVRRNTGFGS